MPRFIKKPGNILTAVMGLVAVGVLTLGSILSSVPSNAPSALFIVSSIDVEVELRRVGINPESLAASGVTSGQVAVVVADGRAYLDANLQAMRNAEAAHAELAGEVQRLQRLRRSGQANDRDLTDLATAETGAARELTTINAMRGLLFDAATDRLPDGAVSTLETIAANERWSCPIQYRCTERSETDWLRLRDALANERICSDLGDEADPTLRQLITECDSEPESAAASANLGANLEGVRAAFDIAIRG